MLALLKLNQAAASAALTLDSRSRLRRPLASQTRRCVVVSTREGLKYGERFWQQRSVNYFAYGSNLSTEVITVRLAFERLVSCDFFASGYTCMTPSLGLRAGPSRTSTSKGVAHVQKYCCAYEGAFSASLRVSLGTFRNAERQMWSYVGNPLRAARMAARVQPTHHSTTTWT